MVVRKPSPPTTTTSSSSTTSSTKSSLKTTASVYTEEWDADDEDAMSQEGSASSRPLSVAIPNVGPYCPRRPNLREILANTSSPPWTLAAFMAYLSNNHCLETLEFTMDAGRYKKHYAKMMSRAADASLPPSKDREYVQALWERLVDAYIRPNGSREVNLPSEVRDPILRLQKATLPPAPEKLDPAVAKIYELMEESVLVPFLNSVQPQTAIPTVQSCPFDDDNISVRSRQYDERSAYARRSRSVRSSPPISTAVHPHANSYSPPSANIRHSAHPLSPQKSRFSVKLTPTTSAPASHAPLSSVSSYTTAETGAGGSEATLSASGSGSDWKGPGMTDSSGDSPTNEGPMTPPTSPPGSDGQSPKRGSGMWKRLGRLSGVTVGKKKSHGTLGSKGSSKQDSQ